MAFSGAPALLRWLARPGTGLLAAGALLLPPPLAAQAPTPEAPAPSSAPAAGRNEAQITDPATDSPRHVFGDARVFRVVMDGDRLECTLTMARPLLEGMFTMVELFIDCDDRPATGIDGRELRIRAAVGSRFQPSAAAPTNGGRRPIDHVRISGTDLQPDGNGGKRWIHRRIEADPPRVLANELRFWFPRRLVRERGDRYHGRIAMTVRVETSCSDQPLERLHLGSDEGLPIVVDGRDVEWSAVRVRDPGGELHDVARCVDITGLRVDHGADCLYACAEFAAAGFADSAADDDVQAWPSVTFLVEPVSHRYQEPYEVTVFGGVQRRDGSVPAGPWNSAAGDRLVEAQLPRHLGQTRVRVLVLSDLVLHDDFGHVLRLDTEAR